MCKCRCGSQSIQILLLRAGVLSLCISICAELNFQTAVATSLLLSQALQVLEIWSAWTMTGGMDDEGFSNAAMVGSQTAQNAPAWSCMAFVEHFALIALTPALLCSIHPWRQACRSSCITSCFPWFDSLPGAATTKIRLGNGKGPGALPSQQRVFIIKITRIP